MMKQKLRGLTAQPVINEAWGTYRRWQLHRRYRNRREDYARRAIERALVYREGDAAPAVRERLAARGYTPAPRNLGQIHTFAFVPHLGWHTALLPDLRELGPVTEFDYVALGVGWPELRRADANAIQRRREMNALVLPALREAHARRPVDWVFVYASGLEISAGTVSSITDTLGIPTVMMCLDDKQSWVGPFMGDHRAGQVDVASVFDLSWTSARVATEWYLVEGGRPIYMPEGFDAASSKPIEVEQDIPVSFIGGAYGFRPRVILNLRRHGVDVRVFGPGWGTESVWGEQQNEIINRSQINLGMGGIGYSEDLTNVKTRDFEIPGAGGGVYLTSFNPDLAEHFVIGEEILCYRSNEEMVELIRRYLADRERARAVAIRGRERCMKEHRWLHRYIRIAQILQILPEPVLGTEPSAERVAFMPGARREE